MWNGDEVICYQKDQSCWVVNCQKCLLIKQTIPQDFFEEASNSLLLFLWCFPSSLSYLCPIIIIVRMQQKVESFDTPPPNYNLQQHATNGFSQRPSAAQLASYVIIATSIAIYFSSTLPLNNAPALLALYIIFGVIMCVSAGLATIIDPTDRVVYYYKWSRHDRKIPFAPEYDKVLFCEFCDSYCWVNSKHCRTCNRCVNDFDHHCMWFNNCVGARNYWFFFVSILATFAYSLVVALHVALASFKVDFGDSGQLVRIVFSWIIAVVLAVFGFLIINLIILHIYLLATQQTTYQFLQRKKKEQEDQRKEKSKEKDDISMENIRKQSSSSFSTNQVYPLNVEPEPEPETQPKPIELLSEQSVANTKIVAVKEKGQSPDALSTGDRKSRRKVSKDFFEEQMAKHIKKPDEYNSSQSNQQQNDVTVIQEEQELQMDESRQKLPGFLRKNKSIKLLLSQTHAERPSRKKIEPNSFSLN